MLEIMDKAAKEWALVENELRDRAKAEGTSRSRASPEKMMENNGKKKCKKND